MLQRFKIRWINLLLGLCVLPSFAQDQPAYYIGAEAAIGYTAASNEEFPDRNLQKQFHINFTWDHSFNTQEWAYRLNRPRTGLSLGYTDFGNSQSLGSTVTLLSFLEFKLFKKKNLQAQIGLGGSYFNRQFDMEANFFNRAVSTDFTWSFRSFFYYTFLDTPKADYRLGAGIFHHSNGHTRLPNNGFNSFLVSASARLKKYKPEREPIPTEAVRERIVENYISIRSGIGQNVLNDGFPFNDKKEVYTISAEYGKVYNKTFKVGVGAFYRVYEHYYDYIRDNEFLVRDGEEFDFFKDNPWSNAANFGVYVKGELLLNHIGVELLVGANIHKPAYRIDWRLNEGWDFTPREIPDFWVLGEFNSKFRLKHLFVTRLGLKYYLKGTNQSPQHNIYAGVFINANLGQADFTEFGLGYVYRFKRKLKG